MVQPVWKTVGHFLMKLNIYLRYSLPMPPEEKVKTHLHAKLDTDVYGGFIHSCPKLEITQKVLQLVNEYTSWCVQTMEHSTVIKRKEPLRYAASWMNLKCILLNKRRLYTRFYHLNRNYRGKSKIIGNRKIIGYKNYKGA